jgi:DNA-binding transcriptional MocR family regulator
MFITVDPALGTTIKTQIIDQIKKLADERALESGTVLPSSRKLAQMLGISRHTVYQAYSELQAMGYLSSRPGSYNVVQNRQRMVSYDPNSTCGISWKEAVTEQSEIIYQTYNESKSRSAGETSGKMLDMSGLTPDRRLFPMVEFRRSMSHVIQRFGPTSLEYCEHRGYLPLRDYLARRLRLHGISVSAREIMITNGAQQALDLVLRLLAQPGKSVVIESPTYSILLPLLQLHRVQIVPVPMRKDGMDLDVLEEVLKKNRVSLVYTMPNFHNPTGITTNHTHRERLLELCTKAAVPIVEDGFEEDLKYFGRVDLPIKSMDEKNCVIYIGTFSKALFPGLRLGWIAAHQECVERMTAIKRYAELSSSNLTQVVMHHFCEQGYYDRHLKRLYRTFRKRMELALNTMDSCLPKNVTWTRPLGGFLIWVCMPWKLTRDEFHTFFAPFQVRVSPGMLHFPEAPAKSNYFRISISSFNEKEIKECIRRLDKVLDAVAREKEIGITAGMGKHRAVEGKSPANNGRVQAGGAS